MLDKRQYRFIELTNGLRCLLVQNEEKEGGHLVSQCALDVSVGSINDPPDVPGLTKLVN